MCLNFIRNCPAVIPRWPTGCLPPRNVWSDISLWFYIELFNVKDVNIFAYTYLPYLHWKCVCLSLSIFVSRSVVLTSCDPIDCSPPGTSIHGILQARTLEWVATPFSRGSCQPRDWTQASCIACRFFTTDASGNDLQIFSPILRLVLFFLHQITWLVES